MKKIKLTVASLLLGGMCYGQNVCTNIPSYTMVNDKELAYLAMSIEDLTEWISINSKNDIIPPEVGRQYVLHLFDLQSKVEHIRAGLAPYTQETFDKLVNNQKRDK